MWGRSAGLDPPQSNVFSVLGDSSGGDSPLSTVAVPGGGGGGGTPKQPPQRGPRGKPATPKHPPKGSGSTPKQGVSTPKSQPPRSRRRRAARNNTSHYNPSPGAPQQQQHQASDGRVGRSESGGRRDAVDIVFGGSGGVEVRSSSRSRSPQSKTGDSGSSGTVSAQDAEARNAEWRARKRKEHLWKETKSPSQSKRRSSSRSPAGKSDGRRHSGAAELNCNCHRNMHTVLTSESKLQLSRYTGNWLTCKHSHSLDGSMTGDEKLNIDWAALPRDLTGQKVKMSFAVRRSAIVDNFELQWQDVLTKNHEVYRPGADGTPAPVRFPPSIASSFTEVFEMVGGNDDSGLFKRPCKWGSRCFRFVAVFPVSFFVCFVSGLRCKSDLTDSLPKE
jgi:hypothetical protein